MVLWFSDVRAELGFFFCFFSFHRCLAISGERSARRVCVGGVFSLLRGEDGAAEDVYTWGKSCSRRTQLEQLTGGNARGAGTEPEERGNILHFIDFVDRLK